MRRSMQLMPNSCSVQGYDATSHFETTVDDVLDMYFRITNKHLDLENKANPLLE